MLGKLFEVTTALVSSTYDVIADVADYVVEDIKSIPDSIEKGWEEGLISDSTTEKVDEVTTKLDVDTI